MKKPDNERLAILEQENRDIAEKIKRMQAEMEANAEIIHKLRWREKKRQQNREEMEKRLHDCLVMNGKIAQ